MLAITACELNSVENKSIERATNNKRITTNFKENRKKALALDLLFQNCNFDTIVAAVSKNQNAITRFNKNKKYFHSSKRDK